MSKYHDPTKDFKLIHATSFTRVADRSIMILSKFLNGLGLADHFHECFLAIHLATDWDSHRGYKTLSLWLMAKKLAVNNSEEHITVFNRLKKKWKSFLDLLDSMGITLIEYNRVQGIKTTIEYKYRNEVLGELFSIPLDSTMSIIDREVQQAVNRELKVHNSPKSPRQTRTRSPESIADSAVKLLVKLRESTSSDDEYRVELELAQERLGMDVPDIKHSPIGCR